MQVRGIIAAFVAFLLCAASAPAHADGIRVSPVAVAFPASTGVGSVRIENGRDAPVSFQIDLYRWTQEDGRDVLTPTRDLAAAPTVFEIAPGAGRIVRLALAPARRGAATEQAYRLIARELPSEIAPTSHARIVLELSLPVFATVRGGAAHMEVRRDGGAVHIRNAGNAHLRLLDLKCEPAIGVVAAPPRYLLAQSGFSRPVPDAATALKFSFLPAGANEIRHQTHRLTASAPVDVRLR